MTRKRAITILVALLIYIGICFGAAITHDPWDGTGWNTSAPNDEALVGNTYKEIYDLRKGVAQRINKEHVTLVSTAAPADGGEHLNGSAVANEGTSTPTKTITGGSVNLANIARDRGRLWIDDNYDPPVLRRWTGSAFTELVGAHLQHATALEFLLESTEDSNADGAMDSKIRAVGFKAAAGDCDLVQILFSHDGTGNDQKGKLEIKVNDGDDDNAPSKTVLAIGSDELAEFSGAVTATGLVTANASLTVAGAITGNCAGSNTPLSLQSTDATANIELYDDGTTGGYESAIKRTSDVLTLSAAGGDNRLGTATGSDDRSIADKAYVDASSVKAWVLVASDGTKTAGYNITSTAKTGTGDYTIVWDTNFASANYAVTVTPRSASLRIAIVTAITAEQCTVTIKNDADPHVPVDASFMLIAVGTQ